MSTKKETLATKIKLHGINMIVFASISNPIYINKTVFYTKNLQEASKNYLYGEKIHILQHKEQFFPFSALFERIITLNALNPSRCYCPTLENSCGSRGA